MAIVAYKPPFNNKTGKPIVHTRCVCVCDWCNQEWEASWACIKKTRTIGAICNECSENGPPLWPEHLVARYPQIVGITKLGTRGSIVGPTMVEFQCDDCGGLYSKKYDNLGEPPFLCWSCSAKNHFRKHIAKRGLLYPEELIDVLDYDERTLGSLGQVVKGTSVLVECLNGCGNQRWVKYGRKDRPCISCITKEVWTRPDFQEKQALAIKKKWSDPEFLERYYASLANRRGPMSRLTGFHMSVKKALDEHGLCDFISEYWLPNRIVPDEIDFNKMAVIEANGTYWHADPRVYSGDHIFSRGDRTITAQQIWNKDRERETKMREMGLSVFIVWEQDWEDNSDTVMENLIEWYNSL